MAVTLQQALANHQNLLGAHFENLGKSKRIYLSYNPTKGWSIENFTGCLGFVKNIFRWLGLYYSSTQLKNVAPQVEKEAGVPPALLTKIQGCWQKQSGQQVSAPVRELPKVNEATVIAVPDPTLRNRIGVYVGNTLISIEQGDVTKAKTKAIVNAANNACLGGDGVDRAVHLAAGPALLQDCRKLPEIRQGVRCETGSAVITVSGNLAAQGTERVIHAVGPVFNRADASTSARVLQKTYVECLELAHKNGIKTIAFPAISTGIYGFPFNEATRIAMQTVEEYAHQYPDRFNEIKLVFIGDMYNHATALFNSFVHPYAVRDNFMG